MGLFMRLVEFHDLMPGMEIADDCYGINGDILAKKGTVITDIYIESLSKYEIPFIYILDAHSEDLNVNCSINSATRNEATQNLKKLYEEVANGSTSGYHKALQACLESVEHLTETIISENIDLYDVFDIKLIENYRYQQPVNVTIISLIIGKSLELSSLEMYRLACGAFFHDIGNALIPESILSKNGKLSPGELAVVRTHTEEGFRFAKDEFNLPMRSYLAILQHHERFDGKGYPLGKKGEDINIYGRIVAIADVFDALSSRRRTRQALSPTEAFKAIIEGAGKQFDPTLVRAFIDRVSPYPIGYTLKLPDGRVGIVAKNYRGRPFNPTVRVIQNKGKAVLPYMHTI